MTSKTHCKYIISAVVLVMSFSGYSFAQSYSTKRVDDKLPKNYPNKLTPAFDKNKLSYGAYFGLNAAAFTASLGGDFTPALGFAFGFEISCWKICGFFNANMAFGKTIREFDACGICPEGRPYSFGSTDFSLGYFVFDSEPWKICPFVGYSISEFSVEYPDAETNNAALMKFCSNAGIAIDYKFHGDIFLMSKTHRQNYLEFNVKTRLFGSYFDFSKNAAGHSINLTIGVSVVKRPMKIVSFLSRQSTSLSPKSVADIWLSDLL